MQIFNKKEGKREIDVNQNKLFSTNGVLQFTPKKLIL